MNIINSAEAANTHKLARALTRRYWSRVGLAEIPTLSFDDFAYNHMPYGAEDFAVSVAIDLGVEVPAGHEFSEPDLDTIAAAFHSAVDILKDDWVFYQSLVRNYGSKS